MKLTALFSLALFAIVLTLPAPTIVANPSKISVKEYEQFHTVLHPLEHESLPKRDFESIRAKADELVRLGSAIVKLGVPKGTKAELEADFKQELEKFGQAIKRFAIDARDSNDESLKTSFSAVHDSFEMLAAMLPRN
jgi:hypothetical protein